MNNDTIRALQTARTKIETELEAAKSAAAEVKAKFQAQEQKIQALLDAHALQIQKERSELHSITSALESASEYERGLYFALSVLDAPVLDAPTSAPASETTTSNWIHRGDFHYVDGHMLPLRTRYDAQDYRKFERAIGYARKFTNLPLVFPPDAGAAGGSIDFPRLQAEYNRNSWGAKILMIKILRENTRCGLKEAKDTVDAWHTYIPNLFEP